MGRAFLNKVNNMNIACINVFVALAFTFLGVLLVVAFEFLQDFIIHYKSEKSRKIREEQELKRKVDYLYKLAIHSSSFSRSSAYGDLFKTCGKSESKKDE